MEVAIQIEIITGRFHRGNELLSFLFFAMPDNATPEETFDHANEISETRPVDAIRIFEEIVSREGELAIEETHVPPDPFLAQTPPLRLPNTKSSQSIA